MERFCFFDYYNQSADKFGVNFFPSDLIGKDLLAGRIHIGRVHIFSKVVIKGYLSGSYSVITETYSVIMETIVSENSVIVRSHIQRTASKKVINTFDWRPTRLRSNYNAECNVSTTISSKRVSITIMQSAYKKCISERYNTSEKLWWLVKSMCIILCKISFLHGKHTT